MLDSGPRFDNFDEEYTITHEVAEEAKTTLERKVNPSRDQIEKELVEVVRTSQSLREKLSELERKELEYEEYLMNDVRERMEGKGLV